MPVVITTCGCLRTILVLAVGAALAVSGCSDDEDEATPSTTERTTAGTTPTGSSNAEAADDRADDLTSDTATTTDSSTADVEPSETGDDSGTEPDETGDPDETSDVVVSDYLGSYSLVVDEFGTMVTVTVDDGTRTIETNAIPDHDTGEFPNPGNPNAIAEQDLTWVFPLEPIFTGDARDVRTTGVGVNGIKFEPATAESVSCASGEMYRVEALQDVYDLGFDFNNAHVQPTGEYHYHGVSQLLVEAYGADRDLVHIGFASDGHLMYYSKSAAFPSSYALASGPRTGSDCELSLPGGDVVDLEGTSPDGTYTSDWVFDESFGALDECNGATIDGQYVYLVTDTFPFVSRCLNGRFDEAGVGGGAPPPGGAGGAGAVPEPPALAEAAAALGVSEAQLAAALGPPPPDLDAAAEALGVTVDDLEQALSG